MYIADYLRFIPKKFGSEAVGVGTEDITTSLEESGQAKTKLFRKLPA